MSDLIRQRINTIRCNPMDASTEQLAYICELLVDEVDKLKADVANLKASEEVRCEREAC